MTYTVDVSEAARKAFLRLPKSLRQRMGLRLRALADDPRPQGARSLKGTLAGYFRIRVGDHRVVYAVDDGERRVWVIRIGPRRSVYDGAG